MLKRAIRLDRSGGKLIFGVNAVGPVNSYARSSTYARPLQDSIDRFEVLFAYLLGQSALGGESRNGDT